LFLKKYSQVTVFAKGAHSVRLLFLARRFGTIEYD